MATLTQIGGSDCNDCRSTTGYLVQIGGTAVTWKSQKQSCVALSTAEAEYMALSSTAQEAVWMRELNSDLGNQQSQPTLIFEDNQSAISMAKNPQFHGRSKHINIKYHFIREQVSDDKIRLKYCPTEDMLADLFTKGIGSEKFERLEDCVECAIKCRVRRSVEGMHSPQFAHAHKTTRDHYTFWNSEHYRTFFSVYVFIYSLLSLYLSLVHSLLLSRCVVPDALY